MITLYGYWRSSCAWRVRTALTYKNLPYLYTPVNLSPEVAEQRQPEFLRINPLGQVPVLEEKGLDGHIVRIGQSLAILEYLEERYPALPLLPENPRERALCRQVAHLIVSGIQPLQNTLVVERVHQLVPDLAPKAGAEWAKHFIDRGLAALELLLQDIPGPFAAGERVSLADVCLVPQLYNARRFHVEVQKFPRLLHAEAACLELPAFQHSHPEKQPDAPVA